MNALCYVLLYLMYLCGRKRILEEGHGTGNARKVQELINPPFFTVHSAFCIVELLFSLIAPGGI